MEVWDLLTGRLIGQLTGHTGAVTALATTQLDNRPVIISGSSDQTVRAWDLTTGALIGQPLTGHTAVVFTLATTQLDGRPVIISGSRDDTIRTWDLVTRTGS